MDLIKLFGNNSQEVVLELGAHMGKTTRILSQLFGTVLAVEQSPVVLKQNAQSLVDLKNVVHFNFHSVLDDWSIFANTKIDVAFIDADHAYPSVMNDLERVMELGSVHSIILDDYGAHEGVHRAVTEMLASKSVSVKGFIGRAPPWTYDGKTTINDWEGIVLEPLRDHAGIREKSTFSSTTTSWDLFPENAFSSGRLTPTGRLDLEASGYGRFSDAESSGEITWKEAADTIQIHMPSNENEGPLRAQVNSAKTAMLVWWNVRRHIAIRRDVMRVIRNKFANFFD